MSFMFCPSSKTVVEDNINLYTYISICTILGNIQGIEGPSDTSDTLSGEENCRS